MRTTLAIAGLGIAAVAAIAAGFVLTRHGPWRGNDVADNWSMLDRYCVECHNNIELAGGIAFDRMHPEDVSSNAEIWERVVRKLRGAAMPPPGNIRPDSRVIESFVSSIETRLDEEVAPRPGYVGLHRLNRREYANAVRDLLGVDVDPSALLPRDDASAGFDNIASGLTLTPVFVSQFVDAARTVTDIAVGAGQALSAAHIYTARSSGVGGIRRGRPYEASGLPLGVRDGIVVTHAFPVDGEYSITINDLARSMNTNGAQYDNRIVVAVGGKIVYETVVGGDDDLRTIDQQQDVGAEAINIRLRDIRFTTEAGQREVAVLFPRRTHAESEELIEQFSDNVGRAGNRQQVLNARSFEIRGPIEAASSARTVASREKVFSCYPDTVEDQNACAEEIIGSLAALAYRRPLAEHEMDERLAYYHMGKETGGFEGGIRMAIIGILASPHFLFRADSSPVTVLGDASPATTQGRVFQLNDIELASRLAFFLWSSLPDEQLLTLAAAGELRDQRVLKSQVRRMLADSRAETLAMNFAHQWLQLGKMDAVRPDAALFPGTAGRLDPRPDFLREVSLFIDSIFREDRSVLDLLSADHTFVNETLAWRYGIEGVRGNHFRRVRLEQSTRWGLLGKGALLLASSYPNRTSPVLRGDYILHNIIGVPPPPPPPGVDTNLEAVAAEQELTVRERLAVHSQNPTCNSCHGVMDPLGFALENFSVDGTWREAEPGSDGPIDSSGVLPDGTEIDGPDELRKALLTRPEQFVQTFAEKLLAYAVGRKVEWYDMPAIRKIVRDSADDEYRFSAVVMAIVQSVPFGMREVDSEAESIAGLANGGTLSED